jgi:membrane protease YdiL (CAAX protease family)
MSGFRAFTRTHRVLVFFALAYLLTWAPLPWGTYFTTGALIAALIVAYVADGAAGLKQIGVRLIRWRVNWIWYALALAVPLAVNAATMGLTVVTGAPVPDGVLDAWLGVPLAIAITVVNPLNGPLSEEPSFRGYALPILQNRRTPLLSAAILAVLVTIWHGPLFFIDQFHLRPYEAVTTVAVTFWYVWLFDHAGGSALITVIAHAAEGSVNIDGLYPEGGGDATRAVVFNLLLWCAVAIALLAAYRRFWTSTAPGDAREPQHPDGLAAGEPTTVRRSTVAGGGPRS